MENIDDIRIVMRNMTAADDQRVLTTTDADAEYLAMSMWSFNSIILFITHLQTAGNWYRDDSDELGIGVILVPDLEVETFGGVANFDPVGLVPDRVKWV